MAHERNRGIESSPHFRTAARADPRIEAGATINTNSRFRPNRGARRAVDSLEYARYRGSRFEGRLSRRAKMFMVPAGATPRERAPREPIRRFVHGSIASGGDDQIVTAALASRRCARHRRSTV
jgi:hypothetical protein